MKGVGVVVAAALVCLAGPAGAGRLAALPADYPQGAIVISQSARTLYFVLDGRRAIAYPVAVAKRGMEWSGWARVIAKYVEPAWSPPDSVRRDHPGLPAVIPGGSPSNPMGARALALRPLGDRHPRRHGGDARLDRPGRVVRLHPYAERGCDRPLRPRRRRRARPDDAVT